MTEKGLDLDIWVKFITIFWDLLVKFLWKGGFHDFQLFFIILNVRDTDMFGNRYKNM